MCPTGKRQDRHRGLSSARGNPRCPAPGLESGANPKALINSCTERRSCAPGVGLGPITSVGVEARCPRSRSARGSDAPRPRKAPAASRPPRCDERGTRRSSSNCPSGHNFGGNRSFPAGRIVPGHMHRAPMLITRRPVEIPAKDNQAVHVRAMSARPTPGQLFDIPPEIVQSGPEATPRLPARSSICPEHYSPPSFARAPPAWREHRIGSSRLTPGSLRTHCTSTHFSPEVTGIPAWTDAGSTSPSAVRLRK